MLNNLKMDFTLTPLTLTWSLEKYPHDCVFDCNVDCWSWFLYFSEGFVLRWPLFSGHIADPNNVIALADCWWTKSKVTCVLLGACITLAIFLAATTMYYRRKARQLQLENKVRFHLSWFGFSRDALLGLCRRMLPKLNLIGGWSETTSSPSSPPRHYHHYGYPAKYCQIPFICFIWFLFRARF